MIPFFKDAATSSASNETKQMVKRKFENGPKLSRTFSRQTSSADGSQSSNNFMHEFLGAQQASDYVQGG